MTTRRAILAGAVLGLAGCTSRREGRISGCAETSAEWAGYQHDPTNAGRASTPRLQTRDSPRELLDVEDRRGGPVADGSTIYVGDPSGLTAFDTEAGTAQWRLPEVRVDYTPALYCDAIVVPGLDRLYGVDAATGTITWESEPIGAVSGPPLVADGHVFVQSVGTVYKIQVETGTIVESHSVDGGIHGLCWAEQRVYYTREYAGSGSITCLGAGDLQREWDVETAEPILSVPVAHDGRVYAVSESGAVVAVSTDSESVDWRRAVVTDRAPSPLVVDSVVVVPSGNGDGTVGLDRESGEIDWHLETGPVLAPPVTDADRIYVGSMNRGLFAVDLSGSELERWTEANVGSTLCPNSSGIAFKSRFPDPSLWLV